MIATDDMGGVLPQPAETLNRLWSIIHNVTAENYSIMLWLGCKYGFQGGPVPVNVRHNKEFH